MPTTLYSPRFGESFVAFGAKLVTFLADFPGVETLELHRVAIGSGSGVEYHVVRGDEDGDWACDWVQRRKDCLV